MDTGPGTTLFEPSELKLNINNHPEEDEEAVEDQKRRAKVLKAQLENAFDDWSEEDDANDDERAESSCSSHGDNSHEGRNMERGSNRTNGMIFHNLSDISEHSQSRSGYHSSEVSKDSGGGDSAMFSPPRSAPYKFIQQNGAKDFIAALGGSGDTDHYQPIFRNNSNTDNKEKFQPIFTKHSDNNNSENYNNKSDEAYRQAEYNSVEQLQVLYEVRLHEIQRLSSQLEDERRDAASHKQEMFRKLALLEAEKERAVLSRTESSKLLVASKEDIGKLQKEVHSLKQTLATLEKEKSKSDELVELSKVQIQELEQRIALMERCDSNKNFLKQTDIMIKDLKNKHQQEVHLLQSQVDSLNKRLNKKEEDYASLEKKMAELQKAHEVMLVEKSDTINQLAYNLEQSQAQCRQLMASNVSVDNVRLQSQLEDAVREKDELKQTVKTLQAECSMMQSDLAQYESVSKLTLPQGHSSSDETDSIVQMGMSSRPASELSKRSNIHLTDMSSKLKDELHRALLNQKAKRAEIHRLQEIIHSKENQIQEMAKQERIYLAQTEGLNGQLNKMMAEIRELQNKKNTEASSSDKIEEISRLNADLAEVKKEKAVLEREKLEIQQKLDDLTKQFEAEKQRQISDCNKEYLNFHDETVAKVRKQAEEEAELKIKEYSICLEQSRKEVNELKEMYVAVCAAKEQVSRTLDEVTEQLHQVSAERDRLSAELQENSVVRDHLARKLNESKTNKSNDQALQKVTEERDRLQVELDRCVEIRDQLARRVNTFKRENDELGAEIQRLKAELDNNFPQKSESQLATECEQLRNELAAMSARHTLELSSVRTELQGARDRVIQLEKCTRMQFETEIKSLRQDRDMLKAKCDEKEVQIKKLIESRKRPPAMVSVATETEVHAGEVIESVTEIQRLEDRHRRELIRCREEYHNTLAVMEQAHQDALVMVRNKSKEDMERLQEKHQQILEAVKQQVEQQEATLKAAHKQELLAVEERTKDLTVKFFAEEVKKLEAKYIEEGSRRPDPAVLQSLQNLLHDKTREIDVLKQRLAALNEEYHLKVSSLKSQMEADKESASRVMVQWAQEMKNIQGELKLKEAIIEEQREKIGKAQSVAKKYRSKLIKTNQEITSQYMSKCEEYKAKMQEIIEENEKEVFGKIRQLEQVYENREKEIRKQINKKKNIT